MMKLNEKKIIQIMNNKKIRSEDIEIFRLGNEQCAVCVDTLVESTDIPKCSKLSDISRKSVVSSLSDFAAKGVIPKFCIISLTLPKTISKKQVQELSNGFSSACKEFKIQLLGGDTNQGNEIIKQTFSQFNSLTRFCHMNFSIQFSHNSYFILKFCNTENIIFFS